MQELRMAKWQTPNKIVMNENSSTMTIKKNDFFLNTKIQQNKNYVKHWKTS
jgi:hypothetical protein